MTANDLIAAFETLADAPDGVKRLRELVLQLAVRGKLVAQAPKDEAASALLARLGAKAAVPDALYEVPASWAWARFDAVADIASNLVAPANHGDQPHVAPDCIEKGTGRLIGYRTIRQDGVTSAKHMFVAGQILYSKIRPNLSKVVRVDFGGLCSADMYPINPKISRDYLHLYMLSFPFLAQVIAEDNRLAMPKVNQAQLSVVAVAVPPLAEQHRIVARVDELMGLLDRLEAARTARDDVRRAARDAALAALRDAEDADAVEAAWGRIAGRMDALFAEPEDVGPLRQAVLGLAVRGRLVPQDPSEEDAAKVLQRLRKARGVGAGALVPLKDDEPLLFPVAAGWVWTTVGALGHEGEPSIADGPFGSKLKTEHYVAEPGFRVLRLGNVGRGLFKNEDQSCISEEYAGTLSAYHLREGDILVASLGDPPGRACVVPVWVLPALNKADCFRVRPTTQVEGPFIALALNAPFGEARSLALHRGDTRGRINLSHLRSMPIPLPPREEQRRILAKVDALMAICDALEARLTTARDLHGQFAAAAVHHLDV